MDREQPALLRHRQQLFDEKTIGAYVARARLDRLPGGPFGAKRHSPQRQRYLHARVATSLGHSHPVGEQEAKPVLVVVAPRGASEGD